MSNTLLMGQYWETHSIFHRLDPRTACEHDYYHAELPNAGHVRQLRCRNPFFGRHYVVIQNPVTGLLERHEAGLVYFDVYFSL